jgi:hypothetical protein
MGVECRQILCRSPSGNSEGRPGAIRRDLAGGGGEDILHGRAGICFTRENPLAANPPHKGRKKFE